MDVEQLNARPGGHPNSIAWLLWHIGREVDAQLSAITDDEQVWTAQGFKERFRLGEIGDTFGLGHSPAEAAEIRVEDRELAAGYALAALDELSKYVSGLGDEDLGRVIDEYQGEDITLAVRLISIIDDAQQHAGAAMHVAGMLIDGPAGVA